MTNTKKYRNAFLSKTICEISCRLQVLLAKLKADGKFYAVKVLQKKVILKKKEVGVYLFILIFFCMQPACFSIYERSKHLIALIMIESNLI